MKEKLLKIIQHYEIEHQLRKFNEEVFELNEAVLIKEYCDYDHHDPIDDVAEEIADVLVMLNQFKEYYEIKDKTINEIMNHKIDRQLKRIEEEKMNI